MGKSYNFPIVHDPATSVQQINIAVKCFSAGIVLTGLYCSNKIFSCHSVLRVPLWNTQEGLRKVQLYKYTP